MSLTVEERKERKNWLFPLLLVLFVSNTFYSHLQHTHFSKQIVIHSTVGKRAKRMPDPTVGTTLPLLQSLVPRACKQGSKSKAGAIKCCEENKITALLMSVVTFHCKSCDVFQRPPATTHCLLLSVWLMKFFDYFSCYFLSCCCLQVILR